MIRAHSTRLGHYGRQPRTRVYPVEAQAWTVAEPVQRPGWSEPTHGRMIQGDRRDAAHPFAEAALERALAERRLAIETTFARIEQDLQNLAAATAQTGHIGHALQHLATAYSLEFSDAPQQFRWTRPLPWGRVYAHCVLARFVELVRRGGIGHLFSQHEGEPVETLIERFGFHAIDIVPCADGRLAGLTEHILRIPQAVITSRRSYAGAMFDLDAAIEAWRAIELERYRHGCPNPATAPTRYLKIGVYHRSGSQPHHEGCAAHGSDDHRAQSALLERLREFRSAIATLHGGEVALLLVGVDTDNDAIRVHVPDARGEVAVERYLDSNDLRHLTRALSREAAKLMIRERVASCAGVAIDDPATAGMRWLCGYLLKNNIPQVEAVEALYGEHYPELGHAERLIVAGDPIDEVQLRNLAFQTQFTTLEEGERDMAVGLGILGHAHAPRGLAVPVLSVARYDNRLSGARQRAVIRAERMAAAILARHGHKPGQPIVVRAAVIDTAGHIEFTSAARLDCAELQPATEGHSA